MKREEFPSTGNIFFDIILVIFAVALIVGIVAIEAWILSVALSVLLPLFMSNPPDVHFVHGMALVVLIYFIKGTGRKNNSN